MENSLQKTKEKIVDIIDIAINNNTPMKFSKKLGKPQQQEIKEYLIYLGCCCCCLNVIKRKVGEGSCDYVPKIPPQYTRDTQIKRLSTLQYLDQQDQ